MSADECWRYRLVCTTWASAVRQLVSNEVVHCVDPSRKVIGDMRRLLITHRARVGKNPLARIKFCFKGRSLARIASFLQSLAFQVADCLMVATMGLPSLALCIILFPLLQDRPLSSCQVEFVLGPWLCPVRSTTVDLITYDEHLRHFAMKAGDLARRLDWYYSIKITFRWSTQVGCSEHRRLSTHDRQLLSPLLLLCQQC